MNELLNKKVKIFFKDGDINTLIKGVIVSIDTENKFLKLKTWNDKELYIQFFSIDKIEPLGEVVLK